MYARITIIFTTFVFILASCVSSEKVTTRSIQSLGTVVTISIYDRLPGQLFDISFAIVEEIHDLMSLEHAGSDLSRLKMAAGHSAVAISPHTFYVLRTALSISERSSEAFNPLIEPLVSLWNISGEDPRIPSEAEIDEALLSMDLDDLELIPSDDLDREPHRAFLRKEGMGIDLGGIAKGYAADLVSDYLTSAGVERAILDFGGNILTLGSKTDSSPWIIGIQHPDTLKGIYIGTVPSDNSSIVTSGVYERYFIEDQQRYHHILDGATGYPVKNGLEAVVVITDRSIFADAYSTAFFVLGLKDGLILAESMDDIEALFITADDRVHLSSGLVQDFILSDQFFTVVLP